MSNKLMILGSDRKKKEEKAHAWKESGVMSQGRREVETGNLLLGNDKNNVFAR